MPTITELGFRPGPLPDTVLPDYHGHGLANVVATIARHFGLPTPLPSLAEQILPFARLQGVDRIVTLLIDALGYAPLTQALAHGRLPALATLLQHPTATLTPITSTFPSTTVTALTTLATGLPPGHHGLTSEKLYDAQLGLTLHTLQFAPVVAGRPLDAAGVDPVAWFGHPTIYEALTPRGITSIVLNHAELAGSALSRITHRGARYLGCHTLADLCVTLRAALETSVGPTYLHAYWGQLDTIAHTYGVGSPHYRAELEAIDHALGTLLLRDLHAPGTLLLLLAEHGQIDTVAERWTWLNDHPALLALLQAPPAGDHRAGVLYVRGGHEAAARAYLGQHLAHCTEVLTVEEAVGLGLYGPEPIPAATRQRLGQLLLLAKENWVVRYEYPGKARQRWQIGTHGGLSRDEMLVPLVTVRLD